MVEDSGKYSNVTSANSVEYATSLRGILPRPVKRRPQCQPLAMPASLTAPNQRHISHAVKLSRVALNVKQQTSTSSAVVSGGLAVRASGLLARAATVFVDVVFADAGEADRPCGSFAMGDASAALLASAGLGHFYLPAPLP
jgi:hypothetical protein